MTESAGHAAELRAIDLRAYAAREEALVEREQHGLELLCVGHLDSLVDRGRLLRGDDVNEPPYWALPWIGARAIAARLLVRPPAAGACVLDLGCGLGLAGVAAGLAGARVTFADCVDDALAFARANALHHALGDFEVTRVDFTRDRLGRFFDWILAADIVYSPADYAALVDFLDAHLSARGTLLLTESLRADARHVIEMLARRGIAGPRDAIWIVEDGRPERTWLHTLART